MKLAKIVSFLLIIITIFNLNIFATDTEASKSNSMYIGGIKIYVVEPVSRHLDVDSSHYYFGFLDFALDDALLMDLNDTLEQTITWDATAHASAGITENNIMVIAVVSTGYSVNMYACPDCNPPSNPFSAYYTDACAAATTTESWPNQVVPGFTHTVFIEESTADWCDNCPITAEALHTIYESNQYPVFYCALDITQTVPALQRMINDYNYYGNPSCFFDGGVEVLAGANDTLSKYENMIQSCGMREVPAIELEVELTWLGENLIQIDLMMIYGSSPTDINDDRINILPADFSLEQNYPNPFNPSTTISYSLPEKSEVEISIYNILGEKIVTLLKDTKTAGTHSIDWNGCDRYGKQIGSGIYFYKMETDNYKYTRKMALIK